LTWRTSVATMGPKHLFREVNVRSLVVKPRSVHVGDKCRLCPRVIKAGQSIVVDVVPEVRFGSAATRRWHTSCLRAVVDAAPAGADEHLQLRDRIVAAGDAYA
jgi:hypothetical protein